MEVFTRRVFVLYGWVEEGSGGVFTRRIFTPCISAEEAQAMSNPVDQGQKNLRKVAWRTYMNFLRVKRRGDGAQLRRRVSRWG